MPRREKANAEILHEVRRLGFSSYVAFVDTLEKNLVSKLSFLPVRSIARRWFSRESFNGRVLTTASPVRAPSLVAAISIVDGCRVMLSLVGRLGRRGKVRDNFRLKLEKCACGGDGASACHWFGCVVHISAAFARHGVLD